MLYPMLAVYIKNRKGLNKRRSHKKGSGETHQEEVMKDEYGTLLSNLALQGEA